MTGPEQGSLAALFLSRAPPARAPELAALPDLEQRLHAMLAAARATWPTLDLAADAFVGHLAEQLPSSGDLGTALSSVRAEDLYLACACACGAPRAIQELERHVLEKTVSMTFASRDWRGFSREELHQALRQLLLVAGAGGRPKILDYSGRGPLLRWTRAVAERLAVRLYHQENRVPPPVEVEEPEDSPFHALELVDPELRLMKSSSRQALRAALKEALLALPLDHRRLLRLHYVEGLSQEYLATIFRAHRSSISRWLAEARETVLDKTRQRLAQRLDLTGDSVDSLIDLARSDLSVSLAALDEA